MKFYVYVHCRPDGRCFYLGKGSGGRARTTGSRNKHWRAVVASCGGFKARIVDEFDKEPAALAAEVELIELAVSMGAALTNKTAGGEGVSRGNRGRKRTDEARVRMREAHLGKVMTPEAKAKLLAAPIGRPVSEETKARIAAAHRGKTLTAEHKAKLWPCGRTACRRSASRHCAAKS